MKIMQNFITQFFGSEMASFFNVIWLCVFLFLFVCGIARYILKSISLYTVAKRRGLRAYGIAWVPYGSTWVAGSIADHFDRETKGKDRKYRLWLLIGDIVVSALLIAAYIDYFATMFRVMGYTVSGTMNESAAMELLGSLGLLLAVLVPVITLQVFAYIAQYKIYKSCSPKSAVWLLLLAIIFNFGGLESAIPLFCLRKKDDGFIAEVPEKVAAEQKRLELYN